jgi:hypothetical protein
VPVVDRVLSAYSNLSPIPRRFCCYFEELTLSFRITSFVQSNKSEKDHCQSYMAHIADFLVDTPSSAGLNNYIARELSPHSSHDAVCPLISLLSFSDGYIVNRSPPGGREGEVCLEDASTDGTTQIPTVPHKGQTIGSGGTEEFGCRAVTITIHDHRAKWEHREGPITT